MPAAAAQCALQSVDTAFTPRWWRATEAARALPGIHSQATAAAEAAKKLLRAWIAQAKLAQSGATKRTFRLPRVSLHASNKIPAHIAGSDWQ